MPTEQINPPPMRNMTNANPSIVDVGPALFSGSPISCIILAALQDNQTTTETRYRADDSQPSELPVTTPLEVRDIPEHLANTLDSILGQLDVLTQTVSILEERMTLVENVIDKAFDPQRQVGSL